MNGITFARGGYPPTENWNDDCTAIVVRDFDVKSYLPEIKISGKPNPQEEYSNPVEISIGNNGDGVFCKYARYTGSLCYDDREMQIGNFSWRYSGRGTIEHWFDDEAVVLDAQYPDYISGSGLTAEFHRTVAYKRHVTIVSDPAPEDYNNSHNELVIVAEFKNFPQEYRGNWTGRAWICNKSGDEGIVYYTDDLDAMTEKFVNCGLICDKNDKIVKCRHLPRMQVCLLGKTSEFTGYSLCYACRKIRGLRPTEFLGANKDDVCPYLRRLCSAFTGKSELLPEWLAKAWKGDNIVSSEKRMEEGNLLAYEITYIRKRDGFIRHGVVLGNSDTLEAWIYPYMGFIPKTSKRFFEKYPRESARQSLQLGGGENSEQDRETVISSENFISFLEDMRKDVDPVFSKDGVNIYPCSKILSSEVGNNIRIRLDLVCVRGKIISEGCNGFSITAGNWSPLGKKAELRPIIGDGDYDIYVVNPASYCSDIAYIISGVDFVPCGNKCFLVEVPKGTPIFGHLEEMYSDE